GWSKMYAYVYTGDGATAANNAAWPGVEMTATTATDGCRQANAYRYVVPDDLAKGAKVIFNDGGSQQFPGSREPGIAYDGGIVKWDGAAAALPALDCPTDVPVTSVSVSGPGVKAGKATVRKGASLQLAATVSPSNATDRTVSWKSGDTAVATVDRTGKVTGVKAGKATITAAAGGKSASVAVTVTGDVVKVESVRITGATNGRLSVAKGASRQLGATVGPDDATYKTVTWTSSDTAVATVDRTGKVTGVKAGTATITAKAGSKTDTVAVTVAGAAARPMTVWYRPSSVWKGARVYYKVATYPATSGNASMTKSCDGWYRFTIPDTKGKAVKASFTNGTSWDGNGKAADGTLRGYWASGSSMAVASGQVISG
ncbi:Ig-like domain-containing protein, partial [Bifidobacterium angulatum]|uniref:Ig-like domain-containing protein n=1 Tax=Bifidobacterium angulatum TaxID=1683 RepID=UPI00406C33EA